jgi:hypothetical protein
MPADIRSFFGGGPKVSQGSQDKPKKDEVCLSLVQMALGIRTTILPCPRSHIQKPGSSLFSVETRPKEGSAQKDRPSEQGR